MTTNHVSRVVLWMVISTMSLTVAGCAQTAKPASPHVVSASASAAPNETSSLPAPRAAKLTIDGTRLVMIADDGSIMMTIPYTMPFAEAVAGLTQGIGSAPQTEVTEETICSYPRNVANWGDGLSLSFPVDASLGQKVFEVRSHARIVGSGISVETPESFGVGDASTALIVGTPGAVERSGTYGTQVWYDLDSAENGAVAIANVEHGPISFLYAPANLHQDC